ncbi:hypothetical protein QAD02_000194 [Eretmocerus hayati]|uniref:Uncharacterized protein n=1 Tax=Eretmocerus hayati TaxID=131215 RepID=A0ACC2NCS1_9HYME|nr:hypothetical protein QAD02_000194 [Eretmocerus hayati]
MLPRTCLSSVILLWISMIYFVKAEKELKMLHVLSANKFYTPGYNYSSTTFEIPKNLTYKYFLQNAADMPNEIKMQLYSLGVNLRNSYNFFLGSLYTEDIMEMRTTEFAVSMMAAELINAGLWPPEGDQIWNPDLLWQPIPYVYNAANKDAILLGTLCPTFEAETQYILQHNYNLTESHGNILAQINKEGKLNLTNPIEVSLLYLAIQNGIEWKQTIPEWAQKVYSDDNFKNMSLTGYDLLSKSTVQKQLNGGSFLKKILNDSMSLINKNFSSERMINIYSGDERNFAGIMKNLNLPVHELPNAGAALVFELYTENQQNFIKVVYYLGTTPETVPLTLPQCELFCPIEKFQSLLTYVLPKDELSLCNGETEIDGSGDSASALLISNLLIAILSGVVIYSATP